MSTFWCDKCDIVCYDTERGYITGCVHYPPDVAAVNHLYMLYLKTRSALNEILENGYIDDHTPEELAQRIKNILENRF